MMSTSASDNLGPVPRCDLNDAVRLRFALINEPGLNTGELTPANLEPVIRPLQATTNLHVAAPERLEREREDLALLDHLEDQQAARARHYLSERNRIGSTQHLPW